MAQIIAERNKTVDDTLAQVGPKIMQTAQDLNDSLNAEQDSLGPQLQAESQKALKIILIVSGVALLFGVLISLILTRAITGPLKSMFQGLKTLSAGELAEVREKFAEIIAFHDPAKRRSLQRSQFQYDRGEQDCYRSQ